jgi:hypothetical protein
MWIDDRFHLDRGRPVGRRAAGERCGNSIVCRFPDEFCRCGRVYGSEAQIWRNSMQVISLVWGILAILGLGIAFVPCLGSLNWLNIPFAIVGLIISIIATTKSAPGRNGAAVGGIVLNALAVLLGFLRLILGGGVL